MIYKFKIWDTKEKGYFLPSNIVLRLDGHFFDRETMEELHNIELIEVHNFENDDYISEIEII